MNNSQQQMSVYEHIGELRKRLMVVVIFFIIAMIGGFFLAQPIILFLKNAPEAQNISMNVFRLTDPLKVYMQFAFIIALIITTPIILFQLWLFVKPGLYENEQRVTLMYIPVSVLLFLGGIVFAYAILFPFVLQFINQLSERLQINEMYGINEYFNFLFHLTLPFGLLFQLPIVVLFLTRLGIVTPMFLSNVRKYAYFVLFVIAAFITPPDIVSHLMVTLPLFLLYELSIVIARFGYKKAMKAKLAHENKDD